MPRENRENAMGSEDPTDWKENNEGVFELHPHIKEQQDSLENWKKDLEKEELKEDVILSMNDDFDSFYRSLRRIYEDDPIAYGRKRDRLDFYVKRPFLTRKETFEKIEGDVENLRHELKIWIEKEDPNREKIVDYIDSLTKPQYLYLSKLLLKTINRLLKTEAKKGIFNLRPDLKKDLELRSRLPKPGDKIDFNSELDKP